MIENHIDMTNSTFLLSNSGLSLSMCFTWWRNWLGVKRKKETGIWAGCSLGLTSSPEKMLVYWLFTSASHWMQRICNRMLIMNYVKLLNFFLCPNIGGLWFIKRDLMTTPVIFKCCKANTSNAVYFWLLCMSQGLLTHHQMFTLLLYQGGLAWLWVTQNTFENNGLFLSVCVTLPGLQQSCGLVGTWSSYLWNGCWLPSFFCWSAYPDLRKDCVRQGAQS